MNRYRFGEKRALGCECTTSFTCRPCLEAAAARNAAEARMATS